MSNTEELKKVSILTQEVAVTKGEILLLMSYLSNDRKDPSKDRARQRRQVFAPVCTAFKVDTLDELLEMTLPEGAKALGEKVSIVLTEAAKVAALDFANTALSEKDDKGKAMLSGSQQDRMLSLIDRLDALKYE